MFVLQFHSLSVTHCYSHMWCLLYECYDLFLVYSWLICMSFFFFFNSWCRCHGNSRGMGVTWRYLMCFQTETLSASCFSAELEAERTENGWVRVTGFARVPRLPRASGCLGKGSPLSAHLLPALPPRHPRLTRGVALPGVPDVGGVCRRWTSQQHPPRTPLGRHQAEAKTSRPRGGSLHKWHVRSHGQSARKWVQGPGRPGSTTPTGAG